MAFYLLCTINLTKNDKCTVQNIDLHSFVGKTIDKFTWLWYTNLVKKTWQDVRTHKHFNLYYHGGIYYEQRRNLSYKQKRKQE